MITINIAKSVNYIIYHFLTLVSPPPGQAQLHYPFERKLGETLHSHGEVKEKI